jgi:hypothetical protein
MATVTVDQAKLVLNSFAAIFQNNLVSADLVTWNKFSGEMNDRNALEVVEQITPDYTTTFTSSGVVDLSGGVQDTTFGSERYKLDQTIGSSMGWGDFVKIRDLNDARESQALRKAALRLATDIDAYVLKYVTLAANNWLGDGTSAVSEWDDLASGVVRLKEEGVEDPDVKAVLSYADWQALGGSIIQDNASLTDLGSGVYRSGFTGNVAGIPTVFTQQLPAFTTGSRNVTSALTQGTTDAPVTYESVAVSPAPGQYMSQLINIDIGSGTETVKEGEVFTIAGVYAYDARAKKTLDHLQQFRVIGGTSADGMNGGTYTASGGVVSNVRIFPAIITVGPFRTVGAAPANTAVVTFFGAASATLQPRVLANKSSVIVNTADLIMPATGKASRKALTKVPLSVRMWQDSTFATGEHRVRFDVAIKANVSDRRRSIRLNG